MAVMERCCDFSAQDTQQYQFSQRIMGWQKYDSAQVFFILHYWANI